MATNNFLPFCPTDTGTNLLSQGDYAIAADRTIGNQPGVASSKLVNKATRQSAFVVSQISQFVSDKTGLNVLDDADTAKLLAQITAAVSVMPSVFTKYTSGSGSHNLTTYFMCAAGNAGIGATYTNNGNTFTVSNTIAGTTLLTTTASGAPQTSGTLTKATGSGDATIIFYAVRVPSSMEVVCVGAGAGGSGGGGSAGTAGTATIFGSSLLAAGGGSANTGGASPNDGAGGTASLGTSPYGFVVAGQHGCPGSLAASILNAGGQGGSSPFGGAGAGGYASGAGGIAGGAAIANSGSGGGGSSTGTGGSGSASGAGGAAGGYVQSLIKIPTSIAYSFSYSIGAGGSGGTSGSGGQVGGAGGSGVILVTEFF